VAGFVVSARLEVFVPSAFAWALGVALYEIGDLSHLALPPCACRESAPESGPDGSLAFVCQGGEKKGKKKEKPKNKFQLTWSPRSGRGGIRHNAKDHC
jgi:hypothetical protein